MSFRREGAFSSGGLRSRAIAPETVVALSRAPPEPIRPVIRA